MIICGRQSEMHLLRGVLHGLEQGCKLVGIYIGRN